MSIFIVGNILNFLSFAYAAQSLLAALEPGFVTNVIFGYFMLGEPIKKKVILSTTLIIIGNIIVVIYSSHKNSNFTSDQLMQLYKNDLYLIYLSFCLLGTIVGTLLYYQFDKLMASPQHASLHKSLRIVMPLLYSLNSGLLGTQSIIFAKSLSNIVHMMILGHVEDQLKSFFTYVILFLWLGTMVFWLKRMNNALKIFPGNRIIPVLQVVWIIFGVLSGGIYFQEFDGLSLTQAIMSVVGLLFVVLGVVLLAPKAETASDKIDTRKISILAPISDYDLSVEEPSQGAMLSQSLLGQSIRDLGDFSRNMSRPSIIVQVSSDNPETTCLTTFKLNLALSTPFLEHYDLCVNPMQESPEDPTKDEEEKEKEEQVKHYI